LGILGEFSDFFFGVVEFFSELGQPSSTGKIGIFLDFQGFLEFIRLFEDF
jgi:hypothetical protein